MESGTEAMISLSSYPHPCSRELPGLILLSLGRLAHGRAVWVVPVPRASQGIPSILLP